MSPGPEFPGPPPTLFCPGEHCLEPGPGGAAWAGAAALPRATLVVTAAASDQIRRDMALYPFPCVARVADATPQRPYPYQMNTNRRRQPEVRTAGRQDARPQAARAPVRGHDCEEVSVRGARTRAYRRRTSAPAGPTHSEAPPPRTGDAARAQRKTGSALAGGASAPVSARQGYLWALGPPRLLMQP